jgi:hypothetical protein
MTFTTFPDEREPLPDYTAVETLSPCLTAIDKQIKIVKLHVTYLELSILLWCFNASIEPMASLTET